ncbi:hypothetical protein ACWD1Z_12510 [Streptomyces sp. NPDC002784]
MYDDGIRARFDGRSRVDVVPGRVSAARRRRIEEIAHVLGCRLVAVHPLWPATAPPPRPRLPPRPLHPPPPPPPPAA